MHNKKIVHALVEDKGHLGISEEVRQSLRVFYRRNLYIDSLINNPIDAIVESTEDRCMKIAADKGFDYLIMSWEGNIFDIHRYHYECIQSIDLVNEKTNDEWLIFGHVMDQEQNRILHNDANAKDWKNSFWLFPITAIINIKKWQELGRPAWGQEQANVEIIKAVPSAECVHDNYTPWHITASTEKVAVKKVRKGWNIIDASLRKGWPVENLPQNIRECQTYLYPENDPKMYDNFWTSIQTMPKLNGQYRKILEQVIVSKMPRRIHDISWQCFIKNTEDYFPNTVNQGSVDWTDIDTLLLPCSGFKDFIVSSNKDVIQKKFDVIHYDIIKECVEIKQKVIERWDGTRSTFSTVLDSIGAEYLGHNKRRPMDVFHMHGMKSFEEAYDHVLSYFDSEQDLEQAWQKFKSFNHHYIEADMLADPYPVIKLITGHNVYLCLSDIAGWRNNILGYGYQNLRNNIIVCLQRLINKGIKGFVDYKDPGTDLQLWQELSIAIEYLKSPIKNENIQNT